MPRTYMYDSPVYREDHEGLEKFNEGVIFPELYNVEMIKRKGILW